MKDTYKHQGLRKILIESLRKEIEGRAPITDEAVLTAMQKTPRHLFLDPAFESHAYQDRAFQIGCQQTISQPYTVAFQSQLLEVKPREKVLEIGTGSGYQACVLMNMGAKVFTIERQKPLFDKVKLILSELGCEPKLFYGDGYKGVPAFAPFHKIIVTCGAPFIPEALLEQLKPNGMMVIPIDKTNGVQEMQRIIKNEDGSVTIENYGDFCFVPMLQDKEKVESINIFNQKRRSSGTL